VELRSNLRTRTGAALRQNLTGARQYFDLQLCDDRKDDRKSRHPAATLGDDQDTSSLEKFIALDSSDTKSALALCPADNAWEDNFCLAIADHAAGRQAEATSELNKLRALMGDAGAYQYAEIYAQWPCPSDALQWLQTAYRLHDSGLAALKPDALLDPIRPTPQYRALERRLNFPP